MPNWSQRIRAWLPGSKKRHPLWFRRAAYLDRHPGGTFLIVTTGPSLRTHGEALRQFIRTQRSSLLVMACNVIGDLCVPDYHIILNRRRLCTFGPAVHPDSRLLLAPYVSQRVIRAIIGDRPYEEVPYTGPYCAERGALSISRRGTVSLQGGTLATVALGVALVMGARTIYFAGLDGFSMYAEHPEDIHFFQDADAIQFDRRLMHEQCTHGILRDAAALLATRGGTLKILTPTVYRTYYDGTVLSEGLGAIHRGAF